MSYKVQMPLRNFHFMWRNRTQTYEVSKTLSVELVKWKKEV